MWRESRRMNWGKVVDTLFWDFRFWVGPLSGGAFAGILYEILFRPSYKVCDYFEDCSPDFTTERRGLNLQKYGFRAR